MLPNGQYFSMSPWAARRIMKMLANVVFSLLYWTEVNSVRSRVMRCRLNGSDVTTITTSIDSPNGLYLDSENRRSMSLYVLQGVNGSLFQCNLMQPAVSYGQHNALHASHTKLHFGFTVFPPLPFLQKQLRGLWSAVSRN